MAPADEGTFGRLPVPAERGGGAANPKTRKKMTVATAIPISTPSQVYTTTCSRGGTGDEGLMGIGMGMGTVSILWPEASGGARAKRKHRERCPEHPNHNPTHTSGHCEG